MEITQHRIDLLLKMGQELHPHLGMDNHTNKLIKKAVNGEKLTIAEAFDLGKYYSRMVPLCEGRDRERLSALIDLKGIIYGPTFNH